MLDKKTLKPCFCGGNRHIKIKTISEGMDGSSQDWELYCDRCKGHWYLPADDFYGREYYTESQVINVWNMMIEKFKK